MKNPFPLPISASSMPIDWVTKDVVRLQVVMVNVYFISQMKEGKTTWFLVDAGLGQCAARIKKTAEYLYGPGAKPEGILLTHGHFDHIGALVDLAQEWDVPIYAHPLEIPYLMGQSSYPPPDPTVGGGALAAMAGLYPKKPITVFNKIIRFSEDGQIPGLDDWRAIHTPGHTPGHVSFFRESDKTLIAGDAFVTVKQESLLAVLQQKQAVHGPPSYFTSDWQAAQRSVADLAALAPEIAACGHGKPMKSRQMRDQLTYLSEHFAEKAVPRHGRYVHHPAKANQSGVTEIPPAPSRSWATQLGVAGLAALAGFGLAFWGKR